MKVYYLLIVFAVYVFKPLMCHAQNDTHKSFKYNWIQPAKTESQLPIWGHKDGIQVGMANLPGPRGLLRIYTPYLNYEVPGVMNFIAFEPIVKGDSVRGFSELEKSHLDGVRGKRFWSGNTISDSLPKNPEYPVDGIVSRINNEEVLTVFVFSEKYDNGANVFVRLRFFESKPYEFEMKVFNHEDSKQLENFILTATMGNKTRLRKLYLADSVVLSTQLWPDYKGFHFTPHAEFPLSILLKDNDGNVYFVSSPNERNASEATYTKKTYKHWQYTGDFATQYWISKKPQQDLKGLVNGRFVYWASKEPIPGGISFENFELKEKYEYGSEYVFGIVPISSEEFIKQVTKK